jgi:hypothetical protein
VEEYAMATSAPDKELQNLTEQELKTAIKAVWKKHDELAKKDLAPMLYWLRDKLRAQGARNDIQDKDRGFAAWCEENLDISRRTADRWCDWNAVETRLKPTSGHVSKSEEERWEDILDTRKGRQQIAFNYWVKTAVHAQYTKALIHLQKTFGVKDKKEAVVRGVIYAATVINKAAGRGSKKVVGRVPLRRHGSKVGSHSPVRATARAANGRGKAGPIPTVPILELGQVVLGQSQRAGPSV